MLVALSLFLFFCSSVFAHGLPEGDKGYIQEMMGYWRRTGSFLRHAYTANVALMCAGFLLMGYQLTGYFIS